MPFHNINDYLLDNQNTAPVSVLDDNFTYLKDRIYTGTGSPVGVLTPEQNVAWYLQTDTTPPTLWFWDGTAWNTINVDKLDGFDASQTPTANTIPVADANGYLNNWINQGSGSNLDADLVRGLPADFTSSLAGNGYQKLPNGLIIQWGEISITGPANGGDVSGSITVAFPITFPNKMFRLIISPLTQGGYGDNTSYNYFTNNEGVSGFDFYWNEANSGWGYEKHWYVAIGY